MESGMPSWDTSVTFIPIKPKALLKTKPLLFNGMKNTIVTTAKDNVKVRKNSNIGQVHLWVVKFVLYRPE